MLLGGPSLCWEEFTCHANDRFQKSKLCLRQPGIEPRANAWRAFMLPLHHWRYNHWHIMATIQWRHSDALLCLIHVAGFMSRENLLHVNSLVLGKAWSPFSRVLTQCLRSFVPRSFYRDLWKQLEVRDLVREDDTSPNPNQKSAPPNHQPQPKTHPPKNNSGGPYEPCASGTVVHCSTNWSNKNIIYEYPQWGSNPPPWVYLTMVLDPRSNQLSYEGLTLTLLRQRIS